MKVKDINIHEFKRVFDETYAYLYETHANCSEGADMFDRFLKKHKAFVLEFNAYRGDIIVSDREAAAFMMALEELSERD